MTTLSHGSNGRLGRKSLAEQIDRLDTILDGLAEALNDSVADAVRGVVGEAVRQAVQATMAELIANPELLRSVQATPASPAPEPVAPARPSRLGVLLRGAAGVAGRVVSHGWCWALKRVWQTAGFVTSTSTQMKRCVMAGWRVAGLVGGLAMRFRAPIGVALTAGGLAGSIAYFCGPIVASTLAGLASSLITGVVVIAWPLIRVLRAT